MKKIDLHIHTIKTISDCEFKFSLEQLSSYVNEMKLDAIAITNHNMFDKLQFEEITKSIKTKVFPGIEINIGNNGGHLLVIAEVSDTDDFAVKCMKISEKIKNPTDSVTLDEFTGIFSDLKKYLLIPHFDKEPRVEKSILEALDRHIQVGEVSSTKKFIYCKKNDEIVPVIFSDWRPKENDTFPVKQTYINVGSLTIKALKRSFMDKTKVQLSDDEGQHLFQILPDVNMSTGLTVVMGERSSGKSYTLNRINEVYDNIKYIKQFALLEKEPDKAEADFSKDLESQQSCFIQEYLRPFSLAITDVSNIDLAKDEKIIDDYIKSLLKYASETERADAFAKCKLFSENKYTVEDLNVLKDLISAVEQILDARKYKKIIDNNIEREKLIGLHKELIEKFVLEDVQIKKKVWTNELVDNIKKGLQLKTSATKPKEVDFYEVQLNRKKVRRFNVIAELVKKESIIKENDIEGFKISIAKRKFKGAGELKTQSGKKIAFKEVYNKYDGDAYEYLLELKNTEVMEKDYYQFFVKIDYQILNQYGYQVSGGERAEFNLLREINDARQYDMLLIDEPESSFDNIFLKKKVNHLIKDISEEMPVIIVTHNNTVGASIQPDYIIHTKRVIKEGKAEFKLYAGLPTDRELVCVDGSSIPNIEVTLDCLEAGRDAYVERRKEYEMLED